MGHFIVNLPPVICKEKEAGNGPFKIKHNRQQFYFDTKLLLNVKDPTH